MAESVPRRIWLTKGVGRSVEKLASFEFALQSAGVAACNLVRVSSIVPPGCQIISRDEGARLIKPGQITHVVASEVATREPRRLIAASIGLAVPSSLDLYGYISEHHSFGENDEMAGDYAETLATEMLAVTLGIHDFDPDTSWDETEEVFRLAGHKVRTQNVTQTAVGDDHGLWTTVFAAVVFVT
jgi:arginine decarboxylase